jgi:uncharacterized repeat protein (TIGR01451 family)
VTGRRLRSAAAAVLAVLALSVGVSAAAAPPQLSITVTDGEENAAAGAALTYSVALQNTGASDLSGLLVTQTLPDGVTFVSADGSGVATGSTVSWNVDVKAAATANLTVAVTVGETPPELLRLATTVCAMTAPDAAPLVCASDSDLLPAGAQAAATAAAAAAHSADSADSTPFWIVFAGIGVAVLLVVAVIAVVITRRRRRRGRGQGAGV